MSMDAADGKSLYIYIPAYMHTPRVPLGSEGDTWLITLHPESGRYWRRPWHVSCTSLFTLQLTVCNAGSGDNCLFLAYET
jgi:hypothetical protein